LAWLDALEILCVVFFPKELKREKYFFVVKEVERTKGQRKGVVKVLAEVLPKK